MGSYYGYVLRPLQSYSGPNVIGAIRDPRAGLRLLSSDKARPCQRCAVPLEGISIVIVSKGYKLYVDFILKYGLQSYNQNMHNIYTYVYIYMYVYLYVNIYIYIHIYIYICIS